MQALCTVLLSCLALSAARPDIGLSLRNGGGGYNYQPASNNNGNSGQGGHSGYSYPAAQNNGNQQQQQLPFQQQNFQQQSFQQPQQSSNNGGGFRQTQQGSVLSIEPQQLREVPQSQQSSGGFSQQSSNVGGGFNQQSHQSTNHGGGFSQQSQVSQQSSNNGGSNKNFVQQSSFISSGNNGNGFSGVSSGASISSSRGNQGSGSVRVGEPIITKHIYVHAAPEEEESVQQQGSAQEVQKQIHYKIIFIKAPTYGAPQQSIAQAAAQNEEKTIVYVLVKNPEDAPAQAEQAALAPHTPSKPEVFFIKYKSNEKENAGVSQTFNSGASQSTGNGGSKIQFESNGNSGGSTLQSNDEGYPQAGANKNVLSSSLTASTFQENTDMDEVQPENIRFDPVDQDEVAFDDSPVDSSSIDDPEEQFEPSKELQEPIPAIANKNSVTKTVQQISSTKTNGGVSNFASISTSTLTGGQQDDNTHKDYLPPKLNKRSSFRN